MRPTPAAVLRGLLLLTAAVVAATLARGATVATPDVVLPLVVAAGLYSGAGRGALTGLVAGWLVDVMPPGSAVLGTTALVYAACGLLAGAGRREGRQPAGWLLLVTGAAAVVSGVGQIVVGLLEGAAVGATGCVVSVALTWLWAAILVPLLIGLERRLARRRPA